MRQACEPSPKSQTVPAPAEEQPALPATPRAPRELAGNLAGLSLPRQVWVLAIWPFFEQLLNSLLGTVDMALAGRLGPQAIPASNALAAAGYVTWLMSLLLMALGVGSTALIARAIGGRHRRIANAALGQSILLAVIWGLCIGAAAYLAAPAISRFFQLQGQELAMSTTYIRILAMAAPFSAVLLIGAACLRGAGDTRSPFRVMLMINMINLTASATLVFAPPPLGGHGVAGVAGGTAIAWCIGAVLILHVLIRGRGGIKLHLHRLRPHWHAARRIARIGTPNLIESSGQWVGNAIIARIVGGLAAPAALGAHLIAIRVEAFSFLPAIALGTAAATLAGQYLGLGDPRRAAQAIRLCWLIGAGIMTAMGVVFIVAPQPLTRLIAPDEPALYETAATLLRIAGPVQFFFGSYLVLSHALRGAGDTRTAMLLTYASTFLLRLPGAWLMGYVLDLGLTGVWFALAGELVVRGGLFMTRFFHGGWRRIEV